MGLAVASVAALQAPPAAALDPVKIGYVASLASARCSSPKPRAISATKASCPNWCASIPLVAIAAKGLGQSEDVVRLGLTYFDPDIRVSPRDIQASLDWHYAQGMLKMPMEARNVIVFRYAIEAK
jgi:hypothetical protein